MTIKTNTKIYQDLIGLSKKYIDKFDGLIKGVPYERKGILYSEMFFLYLVSLNIQPKRIIESGRARGQSTLILSKIFPQSEIISIEYDQNSKDVVVAKQRLSGCRNVKLLFGDASVLLPKILQNGINDIVLIDGPKGYKAIRLAIKALKYKNAKQIFIHDTSFDTKERGFLVKYLPSSIYSDTAKIAKLNHKLDQKRKVEVSARYQYKSNKPYGYCLACIRNTLNKNYQHLILLSRAIQFYERIQAKLKS